MNFLLGFLGTLLGILVAVFIILYIIYLKIGKILGPLNFGTFISMAKNATSYKREEYSRIKSVGNMTNVLEPIILKDFNDFNKNLLYNKVESNLCKIFTCIENKSTSSINNDNDLDLIFPLLSEKIEDLKKLDVNIKYDNVKFHSHAIKNYKKNNGVATITLSSSLEYYYYCDGKDKNKIVSNNNYFSDIKKQTRYTSQFVYIYDESKFDKDAKVFSTHCPNCGAPTTSSGVCTYCQSNLEPINLKLWKMSSYKEDLN